MIKNGDDGDKIWGTEKNGKDTEKNVAVKTVMVSSVQLKSLGTVKGW